MTPRSPTDAYLSPPCAALALRAWLLDRCPDAVTGWHWLDPFAGAGTLLSWMLGGEVGTRVRLHAFEQDRRWRPELEARLSPARVRICDSFALADWSVAGGAAQPHVITNKPYGRTPEGVLRLASHARVNQRWSAGLMRTDWWQHPKRADVRPDWMLMLGWRPSFGYRREKNSGRVVMSTDRFTGYVWAVWEPVATGRTELEFLERPDVPAEFVAEHRRVARMAYDFEQVAA